MTKRYLRSRFGDMELLEDCVQESLIAIHQARHTYDPDRPFRPWLFAIIRNRTIDMLRRQHHDEPLQAEATEQVAEADPAADSSIGRLLAGLSSDHREALLLTKFWGYSVRESAQALGVSEGVVKVRVHRGIRKIKSLLETEVL